jgi:purine nucleoside permease
MVQPLPIKVVILAMFEPGAGDTVFTEGELRRWVARLPLAEAQPFAFGGGQLHLDRARGVLAILTGVGNAAAASAVTALGLDPRFDLGQAYWVMAGIGGADPERMSIGSAAWIDWVVDGDLMHEVDRLDAPASWSTGRLPLGKGEPFAQPAIARVATPAWRLDAGLLGWARGVSAAVPLVDSPQMAAFRTHFAGTAMGAQPPGFVTGAVLGGSDFWHGPRMLDWARGWVEYWSEGQARFVVSAMEDAGIALALHALARAGRADARRLLMLRTASNYVVARPGLSAAQGLGSHKHEGLCGLQPALENAFLVGNAVVQALLADWPRYRDRIPG